MEGNSKKKTEGRVVDVGNRSKEVEESGAS